MHAVGWSIGLSASRLCPGLTSHCKVWRKSHSSLQSRYCRYYERSVRTFLVAVFMNQCLLKFSSLERWGMERNTRAKLSPLASDLTASASMTHKTTVMVQRQKPLLHIFSFWWPPTFVACPSLHEPWSSSPAKMPALLRNNLYTISRWLASIGHTRAIY